MLTDLAKVFYKNWIKKPGPVRVFEATPGTQSEFIKTLEILGCTVNEPVPPVNSVTYLEGFENLEEELKTKFFIETDVFLDATEDSVVFIRIQDQLKCSLYDMLKYLSQSGLFKIVETYEIGKARDYLIKRIDRKPTICAGLIAKNEERDLPKLLASLEGVVSGIVYVDTGSTDNSLKIVEEWSAEQRKKEPTFYCHTEVYTEASEKDDKGDWKLWNFGKARNRYVDLIDKTNFDYVLWMDADDILLNPKEVAVIPYWDQHQIHSISISSGGSRWPHHRLWKNHTGVRYSGWCHEYPAWSGSAYYHETLTIFHDAAPGAGENSNDRNLRILKKAMQEDPSPRTAFYLANTYKDRGAWAEAVEPYEQRIAYGKGFEDEYWFAHLYKARCERLSKQYDKARKTLMKCVTERPEWSEFWMELAFLENTIGQYDRAIGWCHLGKDRPLPPTPLWREPDKYKDQPYRVISWSNEYLGNTEEAIRWAELAKVKIGVPDADWEARLVRLKGLSNTTTFTRPGALGDVMMTLNLIPAYKKQNPGVRVVYQAHASIVAQLKEVMLQAGCDDVITTQDPVPPGKHISLVGYPLAEGYPGKPMQKHLLEYFAAEMGLTDITKHEALHLTLKSPFKFNYCTVHVKAGWSPYKNWSLDKWEAICAKLMQMGLPVIQIGGPDDPKLQNISGHTLGLSLLQNLKTLGGAEFHLGIDSWTNHACHYKINGRPFIKSLILWGSTQPSAAGYDHSLNVTAGLPCQPCFKEDPKISGMSQGICNNPPDQTYENPKHQCMQSLEVNKVWEEVQKLFPHWLVLENEQKN